MSTLPTKIYEEALRDIELNLSILDPDDLSSDAKWQDRKSAITRLTVMDSAVTCLATQGYAKTSTLLVAEHANISRGAMLHHYPTKIDVIASVIDYINFKRLKNYYNSVKKLTDKQRVAEGAGLETWWKFIKLPEYDAYFELHVASRTDKKLQKIFEEKAKLHDALLLKTLPKVFPEWKDKPIQDLQLAHDFIIAGLTGLHLNSGVIHSQERRKKVRKMIFEAVIRLRDGLA